RLAPSPLGPARGHHLLHRRRRDLLDPPSPIAPTSPRIHGGGGERRQRPDGDPPHHGGGHRLHVGRRARSEHGPLVLLEVRYGAGLRPALRTRRALALQPATAPGP